MSFFEEMKALSQSVDLATGDEEREITEEENEFLALSVKMIGLYIRDAASLGERKVVYECMDMRKKLFTTLPQRFKDVYGPQFMIIVDNGLNQRLTFRWAECNRN